MLPLLAIARPVMPSPWARLCLLAASNFSIRDHICPAHRAAAASCRSEHRGVSFRLPGCWTRGSLSPSHS